MGTSILDVGIGLSLLFLFVSLIVTIVQESIASFLGMRATNLYAAIENLLTGDGKDLAKAKALAAKVYEHPQLRALSRRTELREKLGQWTYLPSYIPSRTFALALLDTLRGQKVGNALGITGLLSSAKEIVSQMEYPHLKSTLQLLLDDASLLEEKLNDKGSVASARLEEWFNDGMSRASGWYKRKAQALSFVIAIVIAVFVNADALYVSTALWKDGNLRASVASAAQAYAAQAETKPTYEGVMEGLRTSTLPVGWDEAPYFAERSDTAGKPLFRDKELVDWFRVLGWLATAFAASLGAPFWFGVLDKGLRMRGSGVQISARSGEPPLKAGEPRTVTPPPLVQGAGAEAAQASSSMSSG